MGAQHRLPARSPGLILALLLAAGCSVAGVDPTVTGTSAPSGEEPPAAALEDGCEVRRPLVVDLHGYSATSEQHEQRTGWHAYGAQAGFAVFSPQAGGQPSMWDLNLDPAVLRHHLRVMVASECVDPQRIYVTGHSMGGFMISHIACELADVVAAVAPVAGVRAVEPCAPARPVPAMIVHDAGDTTVPFAGGLHPLVAEGIDLPEHGPSIPAIATAWAARNGCSGDPSASIDGTVTVERFVCPAGAEVELHVIDNGNHDWPDGFTEAIWAFFEPYRLTPPPAP